MELLVNRDVFTEDASLGRMLRDGVWFGYTCEDKDRKLEDDNAKVQNETAIPRGRYKVILSFSPHFQRVMPELLDVPDFSGVRIHGGNGPADTEGCILLGRVRTADGCENCAERVTTLISVLQMAEDNGEETWITVS